MDALLCSPPPCLITSEVSALSKYQCHRFLAYQLFHLRFVRWLRELWRWRSFQTWSGSTASFSAIFRCQGSNLLRIRASLRPNSCSLLPYFGAWRRMNLWNGFRWGPLLQLWSFHWARLGGQDRHRAGPARKSPLSRPICLQSLVKMKIAAMKLLREPVKSTCCLPRVVAFQ